MNKFVELIPKQSAKYGEREALRFRDYETQVWSSLTWKGFSEQTDRAAGALLVNGVEEQGRVCLFTQNCPEVLITHFGAFYNRAIPVPIYATSSRDEVAYIVKDSGATILFAGDQNQYDIARQIMGECPTLKFIVTLHPAVVRQSDDTTPAGIVMLQSREYQYAMKRGDVLVITVSTGPEKQGVPLLTGKTLSAAQEEAVKYGFRVLVTQRVASDQPLNTVLEQTPAAGELLAYGEIIQVVTSGSVTVQPPVSSGATFDSITPLIYLTNEGSNTFRVMSGAAVGDAKLEFKVLAANGNQFPSTAAYQYYYQTEGGSYTLITTTNDYIKALSLEEMGFGGIFTAAATVTIKCTVSAGGSEVAFTTATITILPSS